MRLANGWARSLVDVAYDTAPSPEAWLRRVTDHLANHADGIGIVGRLVAIEPRRSFGYVIRSERAAVVRALREHEARSEHRIDLVTRSRGAGLKPLDDGQPDRYLEDMRRRFHRVGVANTFHWTALSGCLCASVGLMVGPGERVEAAPQALRRVGEHLASAFEILCRAHGLAETPPSTNPIPALRRLARARDEAHGATEPRALELWEGILRGTWSVIDQHDDRGRRYIVACPRPAGAPPDPRALSPQEAAVVALAATGCPDKVIAHELGIARSTAATHLQVALEKLSLRSRLELIAAFRCTSP